MLFRSADEDPFEAAKRELSEECGLTADNFIDLGVVYATVGYDSEKIYLLAATGLHSTEEICPKNGKTVLDFPKQTGRAMFFSKNIPCFSRKETIQWP